MAEVRDLALYNHGMAFITRGSGKTRADCLDLQFKEGEMNDVLKSLYAVDRGEGRISGFSYNRSSYF